MISTKWLPQSSDFDGPELALHACICNDQHARLRALLAAPCSPHAVNRLHDKWGAPLHVAVRLDSLAAAELLLAAGADPVTPRDYPGAGFDPPAPLMLAIGLGRAALARCLWSRAPPDAHANGGTRPYWSCVAHAARCGQVDILEWLLGEPHRWSPAALGCALQAAARRLDFFCVEMLLSHRGGLAQSALDEALRAAAVDTEYEAREAASRELCAAPEGLAQARVLRALLREGADSNCRCGDDDEPLVVAAARYTERATALQALLEGGADPDAARRSDGDTALHVLAAPVPAKRTRLGARRHYEEGVRMLLAHGASAYTKAGGARGELPLHRAAHSGTMRVFRLYLAALTPVDWAAARLLRLVDARGASALHWAAAGGRCDVLEHLLSLDGSAAHVNTVADHGWTPLLCALVPHESPTASKGVREAVAAARLFLAHGADPTSTTAQGWTPLHCLALHRDPDPRGEAYALAQDLIAGGAVMERRAAPPSRRQRAWWGRRCYDDDGGDARRTGGMTALLWAADRGAEGVRAAMEEAGADTAVEDDDGRDAARVARESCHLREEDDDWLCFQGLVGRQSRG
ncbi:ankyrin [Cordyceps fumosorosea ARSEF 2679]|uniref:Ankyrin n=1 Tax=Cordyceps fumosorosea (strain ARSEF 2679) TaxID=1081104 RepID=A0A167Q2G3_CORFA|nr:ankyrin [Cordyceps fumosorosea ARSEF 2679]OAA57222.1 ankyrin [Cordyceps fumosorosea ARSEF 2679]